MLGKSITNKLPIIDSQITATQRLFIFSLRVVEPTLSSYILSFSQTSTMLTYPTSVRDKLKPLFLRRLKPLFFRESTSKTVLTRTEII